MQVINIKATQAQFEAAKGIETFDDLCTVLSYLSENKELGTQLINSISIDTQLNAVVNKQFVHVFMRPEKVFGESYSVADIDHLMKLMRRYIAPFHRVAGLGDFDINFSAIKRLAGLGVDVNIDFAGIEDTEKESETLTEVTVTFAVVQYPLSFKIVC